MRIKLSIFQSKAKYFKNKNISRTKYFKNKNFDFALKRRIICNCRLNTSPVQDFPEMMHFFNSTQRRLQIIILSNSASLFKHWFIRTLSYFFSFVCLFVYFIESIYMSLMLTFKWFWNFVLRFIGWT